MTRETKLGLIVSVSLLALMGGVIAHKIIQPNQGTDGKGDVTIIAKGNDKVGGAKKSTSGKNDLGKGANKPNEPKILRTGALANASPLQPPQNPSSTEEGESQKEKDNKITSGKSPEKPIIKQDGVKIPAPPVPAPQSKTKEPPGKVNSQKDKSGFEFTSTPTSGLPELDLPAVPAPGNPETVENTEEELRKQAAKAKMGTPHPPSPPVPMQEKTKTPPGGSNDKEGKISGLPSPPVGANKISENALPSPPSVPEVKNPVPAVPGSGLGLEGKKDNTVPLPPPPPSGGKLELPPAKETKLVPPASGPKTDQEPKIELPPPPASPGSDLTKNKDTVSKKKDDFSPPLPGEIIPPAPTNKLPPQGNIETTPIQIPVPPPSSEGSKTGQGSNITPVFPAREKGSGGDELPPIPAAPGKEGQGAINPPTPGGLGRGNIPGPEEQQEPPLGKSGQFPKSPVPVINGLPEGPSPGAGLKIPLPVNPKKAMEAGSGGPIVKDYDLQLFRCGADTLSFSAISQRQYLSDRYAKALWMFNRDHPQAPLSVRQDPPKLNVGDTVLIPPLEILESRYGADIQGIKPVQIPLPPPDQQTKGSYLPNPAINNNSQVAVKESTNPTKINNVPERTWEGSPKSGATLPAYNGSGLYTVGGNGEMLFEIARRTLGDGRRWSEIYRLNANIRPELPIPPGTQLRLPIGTRPPG